MATTLFCLEVAVDAVAIQPPDDGDLVLAFQLLQFDIVLMEDAQLVAGEMPGQRRLAGGSVGRSCLFESEWTQLAEEIQADASAAMVLLVLQRERERARLVAFACVGLLLPHLALDGHGKKPRVSEWVSAESSWPLVNHQHQTLGSITGSVTLSCLGSAVASHVVAQRLNGDVKMMRRTGENASEDGGDVVCAAASTPDAVDEPAATPGDGAEAEETTVPPLTSPQRTTEPTETKDAAVQYEDDDDEGIAQDRAPKPIRIRGGRLDANRGASPPRRRVVDELDRVQKASYSDGPLVKRLEPELPPPMFFHKPKHEKTQRR